MRTTGYCLLLLAAFALPVYFAGCGSPPPPTTSSDVDDDHDHGDHDHGAHDHGDHEHGDHSHDHGDDDAKGAENPPGDEGATDAAKDEQ